MIYDSITEVNKPTVCQAQEQVLKYSAWDSPLGESCFEPLAWNLEHVTIFTKAATCAPALSPDMTSTSILNAVIYTCRGRSNCSETAAQWSP